MWRAIPPSVDRLACGWARCALTLLIFASASGSESLHAQVFPQQTANLIASADQAGDSAQIRTIVTAAIAKQPESVRAIIREALRLAPNHQVDIVAAAAAAFPAFEREIAAAAKADSTVSVEETESASLTAAPAVEWKGEAELGGSRATGNSDNERVDAKLKVENKIGRWGNEFDLSFDFARENRETSAQRFRSRWQTNYDLTERVYAFGVVLYEDDKFSGFEYEVTEGAGLGWRVFDRETLTWNLEAGPGGRHSKEEESGKVENEVVGRARSKFFWKLSDSAELTNDTTFTFSGDRLVSADTIALTTTIIGPLLGRLSFEVTHDSNPPDEETEELNTLSKASLVYRF